MAAQDVERRPEPGHHRRPLQQDNLDIPSPIDETPVSPTEAGTGTLETVSDLSTSDESEVAQKAGPDVQHEPKAGSPASEISDPTAAKEDIPQRANTGSSTRTGSSGSTSKIQIRWSNSRDPHTGIHWYLPSLMLFLVLSGFFGALGHHLYNKHLHGREVKDVAWPQRFGIALAFFIKMVLVGAVQIAFKQRAWLSVKKRGFKVETLDSVFSACYDPAQFLDRELFTGAFLPALLAVLAWYERENPPSPGVVEVQADIEVSILPLSAIASPSTLTQADGIRSFDEVCSDVSILDFRRENGYGLQDRGPNKQAMSYWDFFDNGTYFYNSPSMDHMKIFQLTMLSSNPLQPENPCPADTNCTYTVSFNAPSYKCEEHDDFGGPRTYNLTDLAPYGGLLYASYSSVDEDYVGRPLNWNRTNPDNDTGIFHQEPSFWLGWVINTTNPVTPEDATKWNTTKWRYQLVPHVMECHFYNSTYSYNLSFLQGKMTVNQASVVPNKLLLPPGEFMAPYMDIYQEYSGFHGTGFLYRNLLAGNVSQDGQDSYVITESDISQTLLIDPGNGFPVQDDVVGTIETGFHNIYLSFLSDTLQYSQLTASRPCQTTLHVMVWRYEPLWLAVSYFVAVGLALAAVAVGLHAVAANGYVAQTNFSTFLSTTRNPHLDGLVAGSPLGAWPMAKDIRRTRLRFGEVVGAGGAGGEGERVPHAAFGFPNQVRPLERGKRYE